MSSAVNRIGGEFPERYVVAIQQLSSQLWRRYPTINDPADRDECIELTLRRVADHEGVHGEANNLAGLIWRIFPEVVLSMLRKPRYKLALESMDRSSLENIGFHQPIRTESEDRIHAAELLRGLDKRTKQILYLRHVLGFSHAEIAEQLAISPANSRQLCHRSTAQILARNKLRWWKKND